MASRISRRAFPVIIVCALVAIALVSWSLVSSKSSQRLRRVRIGVDQAAPYQSWSLGRGPVGFSVDVLTEAARKSDIELQWEFHPEGPTRAFAEHKVDLWPLWATKAAAQSGVYASAPWLDNQYAVAWRGDGTGAHSAPPEWRGRTVAIANLPLAKQLAKQLFPGFRGDFYAGSYNRPAAPLLQPGRRSFPRGAPSRDYAVAETRRLRVGRSAGASGG